MKALRTYFAFGGKSKGLFGLRKRVYLQIFVNETAKTLLDEFLVLPAKTLNTMHRNKRRK
jgi:hypothetical protein